MAQLRIQDLTFSYENSPDPVFEHVNINLDTAWRLGLIGRNGKGKTTLLQLLMGKYEYRGSIVCNTAFDYFPYAVSEQDLTQTAEELAMLWKPDVQTWQILAQMDQIRMDPQCLYRPFGTLSYGERTRIMLAVLCAAENEFLLIDEPTNHLDAEAREIVKAYLSGKKGFLLVSHDRDLLDAVTDHVLVLNRKTVEVQTGNFSSWWDNKERKDSFAVAENEKHLKKIRKLKSASDRTARWAEKSENSKIGYDPVKETDRSISSRSYIGSKTKKAQSRAKSFEKRMEREIAEKENLLQDLEEVADLKIQPLSYYKELLVEAKDLSVRYVDGMPLFENMRFCIRRGERLGLLGPNGCGKSSMLKAILQKTDNCLQTGVAENMIVEGELRVASGLIISYVDQDTSFLNGTLREFCHRHKLEKSLLLSVLRQLDFDREQYNRDMSDFSEGQKKKVLLAASLITPAHLYIWDEPLNYIDVFSRMQIEKLILKYQPTMLFVEHDVRFGEKIATGVIRIGQ